MPKPVEFVARTVKYVETLEKGEAEAILDKALESANKRLSEDGIQVFFEKQISPYNMLLSAKWDNVHEYIDTIGMDALDELSIKSVDTLAEEIVQKTKQHIAARKTNGILFSVSGAKIDTRFLADHYVSIDKYNYYTDYLSIDGHRVAIKVENNEYRPLTASTFRSYTIIRLVNEGKKIRPFDDYDLVREDKKGMVIDVSKVHNIAIHKLVERARKPAEDYKGGYYLLERDEMSPDVIKHLYTTLSRMQAP